MTWGWMGVRQGNKQCKTMARHALPPSLGLAGRADVWSYDIIYWHGKSAQTPHVRRFCGRGMEFFREDGVWVLSFGYLRQYLEWIRT